MESPRIVIPPVVAQADPLPSPSFLPNDISSTPPIDFSQPLSSLLKTSTARAHTNVENSAGARALISGLLPRDEYIKYLFMLWHVYDSLEQALDKHANHPALAPTYNARLLSRSEALSVDIGSLLQTTADPAEWQGHPLYQSFLPLPPAVADYTARINELSDSSDPTPLLAHSYVRYLGDLSGGQFIKRIVMKAYGLDQSSINFYEFGKLGESGATGASIGDMRKVKEWFRDGIDAGVPGDDSAKAHVIHEANIAFDYNNGLFTVLETVAGDLTKRSTASHPHHHPIHEATSSEVSPNGINITTFATLLLAVGLAHFLLTTGGFTGSRGNEKLGWVFESLHSFWTSFTEPRSID